MPHSRKSRHRVLQKSQHRKSESRIKAATFACKAFVMAASLSSGLIRTGSPTRTSILPRAEPSAALRLQLAQSQNSYGQHGRMSLLHQQADSRPERCQLTCDRTACLQGIRARCTRGPWPRQRARSSVGNPFGVAAGKHCKAQSTANMPLDQTSMKRPVSGLRNCRNSSSISPSMAAAVQRRMRPGSAYSTSAPSYAVTWLQMISIGSLVRSVVRRRHTRVSQKPDKRLRNQFQKRGA